MIVEDSAYSAPSSFTTLFGDFYALYDLWWTYGSGKEAYGYPVGTEIKAGGIGTKIDRAFDECTRRLCHAMVVVMCHNISDEAENADDDLYADPNNVKAWCWTNGMSACFPQDSFVAPAPQDLMTGKPRLEKMADFFAADFWGGAGSRWDHSEPFNVAGPKWAELCRQTAAVKKALKGGNIKTMVMAVDGLMHLHHNTGTVFDRTPSRKLGIRLHRDQLDQRRDVKQAADFLPFVSEYVKRLLTSTGAIRRVESFDHLDSSETLTDKLLS